MRLPTFGVVAAVSTVAGAYPAGAVTRQKERCVIESGGKVHFKGPCVVSQDGPDVEISTLGRHPQIVAQINTGGDALSVWSGPHRWTKLHNYLGVMMRVGECWVTVSRPPDAPKEDDRKYAPRSKICAR